MDSNEFAARTELLKARLYRTALLYLGSENRDVDAVDEAVYQGLFILFICLALQVSLFK
ncbi:hypothetical protein [Desulfosporosinus meridiei]|uniref:Uncharacterized protein n=1 Tax=Desulfosporosinus meridiei (strain ATCC BAA-275 / DSM 13257 / KCTC 12902 / NCIMB 13706 / S10) TaxID=768704 RepID=J7IZ54_DESMD|nr:hypothetical protein [Desulfosporosinus meridiei]AFQ44328.1 hypothetical protein Desmer_2405 [Desulfosporosinus meridiei DSM 13257]